MHRVSHYTNMLWKVALAGACAAMVVLWPYWRVALSTETYYQGRMTGGGSCVTASARVTHGFELHCDATVEPNNLEINFSGNRFHLESLDSAFCLDTDIVQKPPTAPFDTYIGSGTGRYNGVSGYAIDFTFTDAGEPGKNDTVDYLIIAPNGSVVLDVNECPLTFGNHQAHR
jgi:hypothetical protein